VAIYDCLPTTFDSIKKWLNGKAILHTLPLAVRNDPLRDLVYIYIQASAWGHRLIIHDVVNNMPLPNCPVEFLDLCSMPYKAACAGASFRNYFKKGLPIVLHGKKVDSRSIPRIRQILSRSELFEEDFEQVMKWLRSAILNSTTIELPPGPPFYEKVRRVPAQDKSAVICTCGLVECTCRSDKIKVDRPSDTHTIPRRSGYMETAPTTEVDEEPWTGMPPWSDYDGGPDWDYGHRATSNAAGQPFSAQHDEGHEYRPQNWSSAHLGQRSEWAATLSLVDDTLSEYRPASPPNDARRGRFRDDAGNEIERPRARFVASSTEIAPFTASAIHNDRLEARLREIETKLSNANLAPAGQPIVPSTSSSQKRIETAANVVQKSAANAATAPLATSKFPPAELLQPGAPPVGMPNHVPGYGYNRFVSIGNGVVHPTGPGPYGLAGRSMIAIRNSDVFNCTMIFRAGDLIECVVPIEQGMSGPQHGRGNVSGQRLQGIARTQAGSFPAAYVREVPAGPVPLAGVAVAGAPRVPATTQTRDFGGSSTAAMPKQAATNANAKTATAQNVDSTWYKSAAARAGPANNAALDPRSHSAPVTPAIPREQHPNTCPAAYSSLNPCACGRSGTINRGGASVRGNGLNPTSVWSNDGWDAVQPPSDAELGWSSRGPHGTDGQRDDW
jgi:hypothetical protein